MRIGVYVQTIRGERRIVGKCFVAPGLREVFSQVVVPSVHLLHRADAWTWDLQVMAMIERDPPDHLLMTDRKTGDQWLIGWADFVAHRYQTTPSEAAGPKWACPRKHWRTDQRVVIPYVREEINADEMRAGENVGDSRPAAAVQPDLAAAVTEVGASPGVLTGPPAMPAGWDAERWARVVAHGWPGARVI